MDKATQLLLESILSQIKDNQKLVRSEFEAQSASISGRVEDKVDSKLGGIENKIDRIVEHNERQNGWLQEHSLKIDGLDNDISEMQVAVDGHKRVFAFLRKRWYAALAILAFIVLIGAWLEDHIDAIKVFENKTGIDLIDEPPEDDN